jgi:hypothetical protein
LRLIGDGQSEHFGGLDVDYPPMSVDYIIVGIVIVAFPFAVVAAPDSWGPATGTALRRLLHARRE